MSECPVPVYLDNNATTPMDPQVLEAMLPFLKADQGFGNPGRTHWAGLPAKMAIDNAAAQVAQLINAEPDEIFFTSGGTESVNSAIKGIALPMFKDTNRRHVITSQIEHPASLMACRYLSNYFGADLDEVSVDSNGVVDVDQIQRVISRKTALVNVLHASHEIGTLQPVMDIAEVARANNVPFHVDAVCSVGKNVVDVKKIGCELLSLSGHKFYAPKGIGAVYVSRKIRDGWPEADLHEEFQPLFHGLMPKGVFRPGTPNVAAIVGLGKAAEIAFDWNTQENREKLASKRDFFWAELSRVLGCRVRQIAHENPEKRSPNCLNVSFSGVEGDELLSRMPGMAASSGPKTEAVVRATGCDERCAKGAIRLSLGKHTTYAELTAAVSQFQQAMG